MADLAAAMGLTPLGLLWLLGAVVAAGIVRGFAGFGSALILMPVASTVLDPFAALAFLTAVELFGPLLNLPAAWREGAPREAGLLLLGAVAGLPVGLWLLSLMSADMFSGVVSGAVFAVVALLLLGWRYEGTLPKAGLGGIGVLGGVLAGAAGLAGPPVILLYLASRRAIAVIRANFLLYLLGSDLLMLGYLAALGRLDPSAVAVGLALVLPYMIANRLGALLFQPGQDGTYRAVAYGVILASALVGLPVWT